MMTLHRRAAETAPNGVHIGLREDIKVVCALVSRHHFLGAGCVDASQDARSSQPPRPRRARKFDQPFQGNLAF